MEKEEKHHCYAHEYHDKVIEQLAIACRQNTELSTSNATTLKIMMKLVGSSIVILAGVLTVFIPLMHSESKKVNNQIMTTISGVNSNRNNLKRHENVLHEHETRLRDGGL